MSEVVRIGVAIAAVLGIPLPAYAQENLIVNGSFEEPLLGGCSVGFSCMPGWVNVEQVPDIVGDDYWQNADGHVSLDLDLLAGVAQTFETVPGYEYLVTFWQAGNPWPVAPAIKEMRVTVGYSYADFTFDVTGRSFADMGWVTRSWSFVAMRSTTTLRFLGRTPTAQASALDAVAVVVLGYWGVGDFDYDGDIDLSDFATFQRCFNGANQPLPFDECADADFDGDADVDLMDFAVFQGCFNGPNRPPACAS